MKSFILPAFVILIGAGSAFATQHAKKNDTKKVYPQAYIYNSVSELCEPHPTECSTIDGDICTVNNLPGQQVFGMSELSTCDVVLKQPRNN